jgi:hypothetical protein
MDKIPHWTEMNGNMGDNHIVKYARTLSYEMSNFVPKEFVGFGLVEENIDILLEEEEASK